jgi:membrane-associated phospholipid phosphatase
MKIIPDINKNDGTPIFLYDIKKIWIICLTSGSVFWLIGFILWAQQQFDEAVLFYYNPARIVYDPIVIISQWLTSYGMAAITGIFVVYLLVSQKLKFLDAPLTIYFYIICSLGLSGIAGDLLKEVFARPRPITTYGSEILVLSQSVTPAIPSGHATKSVALILPFILLVTSSNNLHKAVKIMITLIAGGVCLSRIVLGAHYVSDVVAGIGMAVIGLPFTMMFANMILRRTKEEKLPFLSKIWGILLIFLTYFFMSM